MRSPEELRHDPRPRVAEASTLERADIAVAEEAAKHRHSPVVRFLGTCSDVAEEKPLLAICAAVLGAGLVRRDARTVGAGLRLFAAYCAADLAKSAIKERITRSRPRVAVEDGVYVAEAETPERRNHNSFPSGHTARSVAMVRAAARTWPQARVPAYLAAGTVAVMQVPRAHHYPLDLAGGIVVGVLCEAAVAFVSRRLTRQ
jgi:membrane-associated phospholipid phosphatase